MTETNNPTLERTIQLSTTNAKDIASGLLPGNERTELAEKIVRLQDDETKS